jgi:uncharacterized membrane-anchored protein YitT (DUF2179 family)
MNEGSKVDWRETPHTRFEDLYALLVGCLLVAVGLALLRSAGLVTGGISGLALLASHFLPASPGLLFALLNLPFFVLALRVMGWPFTVRTMVTSAGIAALSLALDRNVHISIESPALAALAGGTLIGMAILALARHGAGLGGGGVVTLWLYQSRNWNAGRTQVIIDTGILSLSAIVLPLDRLGWSALSAVAMSGVVYCWHRNDRYTGSSARRMRSAPNGLPEKP